MATLRVLAMDPELALRLVQGLQATEAHDVDPASSPALEAAAVAPPASTDPARQQQLRAMLDQPLQPQPEHPFVELDALEALGQFVAVKLRNLGRGAEARAKLGGTAAAAAAASAHHYVAGQRCILELAVTELQRRAAAYEGEWGRQLDEYEEGEEDEH